jgi:hypothetical protein
MDIECGNVPRNVRRDSKKIGARKNTEINPNKYNGNELSDNVTLW